MADNDISKILDNDIKACVPEDKRTAPVIRIPDIIYRNQSLQKYDRFDNEEDKKDQQSNRTLRERITPQIFWMMVIELIFIAFLIILLLSIPFINALGPVIKIPLPPITLTLSVIVGFTYLFYTLKKYPDDKVFSIFKTDGSEYLVNINEKLKH